KSFFMTILLRISFLFLLFLSSCKKSETTSATVSDNQIKYASGLSIQKYDGLSVMTIRNPWPNASSSFTYVLKEQNGIIPDSLHSYDVINVPIQTIVVTSTTHIPSLEM